MSGQCFAVLIASSIFPDEPKLPPLRCPEQDVEGLKNLLQSAKHGQFDDVVDLKNEPHHKILRRINRMLKHTGKEDLVLVYFSGHGKLDSWGHLYLATVDTVVDELEATSIPTERLRRLFDNSLSVKRVLILDCCFSGAVEKDFAKGASVEDHLTHLSGEGRGLYILSASTSTQVAKEAESDEYSLFTKHLLEGVRTGEADYDSDGAIGIGELYKYVHACLREEGVQQPKLLAKDQEGEQVIAKSGQSSREDRRQTIKKELFRLSQDGMLPDDVLTTALDILKRKPVELVGPLKEYDLLLGQIHNKQFADFISAWYRVQSVVMPEPVKPAKSEPATIAQAQSASQSVLFESSADMVLVPKGIFFYGDDKESRTIKHDYRIDIYPVTNEQYRQFLESGGYNKQELWSEEGWTWKQEEGISQPHYWDDDQWNKPDHPVVGVSWYEADAYARWAKKCLPTEEEWEKAARGPKGLVYPWGDEFDKEKCNSEESGFECTTPVIKYVNGLSPYYCYDMAGNVWEWTESWYDDDQRKSDPWRLLVQWGRVHTLGGPRRQQVDRLGRRCRFSMCPGRSVNPPS